MIDPNYQPPRRPLLKASDYVNGVQAGDRAMLARSITLVESSNPTHQKLAQQILDRVSPNTGESIRIGVTGVPGVGKSTFLEALGTYLTRDCSEKVAVLAVDPSSPLTGGSILGDKTRMPKLSTDPRAFIRPSPSGGELGGVGRRTRETMLLCEAAGYRVILIETVGVGQSELAVSSMVDFFLLLMLANAGDELQGIKRGIVEMTDLIAVNKADGSDVQAAEKARRQYESALHLFPPGPSGWQPRAVTCSGLMRTGIHEIWHLILEHKRITDSSGFFKERRRAQKKQWMLDAIEEDLRRQFFSHPAVKELLPDLESDVMAGRLTSMRAAQLLLQQWRQHILSA